MKHIDLNFAASLAEARDGGIHPVRFVHVVAKRRDMGAEGIIGLWSGDDDITINVENPAGGVIQRTYVGGCNLSVDGLQYVADLTDNPVTVTLSQIADATQQLVRGYDARQAYVEIHSTTMTGGSLTSVPQLDWVGVVDEAPIGTPSVGGDGSITLTVRSELMIQLTAINPAKSSDAHQKRRRAGDLFSKYAGIVEAIKVQWYSKG